MAISSSALTLAQWAKQANDPLALAVVNSLYTFGSVLAEVPIINRATLKVNGTRIQGNLATVNWRKINEDSVTTSSTATPYSEALYLFANNIDVDTKLLKDVNSIGDPRQVQLMAYLEALTYDINDKFFNNSPVTGDQEAPVGLRYRLDNATTWGVASSCKIDGGGVVVTPAGLTASTAGAFFELVEQAFQELGTQDGDNCVIYANRTMYRRMQTAIKIMGAGGGFDMTRDAFDRRVVMYRNAMIRVVGVKADQTTNIITNTETAAGADGSSDYTSLYVVRYGEDRFIPWQMEPMTVQNFPLPDNPVMNRTFIDGSLGYVQNHTRAISRVYNIKIK